MGLYSQELIANNVCILIVALPCHGSHGKKLTILDIARPSGVGKSTVSRVLNQDPKVNAQTRPGSNR